MKIYKIFAIGALFFAGVAFTACSDDDDYAPGQQAGENNVTFASYDAPVLAKTATTFDITLNRHTTSGALTVPIESLIVPTGWSVPESASFASGDSLTSITVTLSSDVELNTGYSFAIRIPEAYTNSYKTNNGETNLFAANVTKEDYETYATGTFDEEFFFGEQWPVTIEYSPALNIYRIKGMYSGAGSSNSFFFKWNGKTDSSQTFSMCASDGGSASRVPTGFSYGNYGEVNITWAAETNDPALFDNEDDNSNLFGGYLPDQNMFVLVFTHRVSAGSFGSGWDFIRNVQLAN